MSEKTYHFHVARFFLQKNNLVCIEIIVLVILAAQSIRMTPERGRNGYKKLLGSFEWTSVTYDWLIVALNTIDQS